MGTVSDWIFWLAGVGVALLALALLYWALFHDRARGRRRCPRCWYDMSGTPGNLTCSECGYQAKRERKLFTTRRRWRWVCVGMMLSLCGLALTFVPQVQRGGLVTVVPTTVLVIMSPSLNNPPAPNLLSMRTVPTLHDHLRNELMARVLEDRMWNWQWKLLVRRCWNDKSTPWSVQLVTRDQWAVDSNAVALPDIQRGRWAILFIDSTTLRFTLRRVDTVTEAAQFVFSPYETRCVHTAQWRDPALPVGALAPGSHDVTFHVEVERLRTGSASVQWARIWSGTQTATLVVADPTSPVPAPNASPGLTESLRRYAAIDVDADGIGIRWHRTDNNAAAVMPTIAARFTLLRDGEPVGRTRAWWSTEVASEFTTTAAVAVPNYVRIPWKAPIHSDALDPANGEHLQLRVQSDPELALHDVRSSQYWAGTFEIPLRWTSGIWAGQ